MKNITIEKIAKGTYRISDFFYGTLITQDYYYYSRREAVKLFKQKIKAMQANIDALSLS